VSTLLPTRRRSSGPRTLPLKVTGSRRWAAPHARVIVTTAPFAVTASRPRQSSLERESTHSESLYPCLRRSRSSRQKAPDIWRQVIGHIRSSAARRCDSCAARRWWPCRRSNRSKPAAPAPPASRPGLTGSGRPSGPSGAVKHCCQRKNYEVPESHDEFSFATNYN